MTSLSGEKRFLVEVCAADLDSVIAASAGGADRIELCANLPEGGTTPSIGLVKSALELSNLPVRVLIRPRPGDFCYSPPDTRAMIEDIAALKDLGVDGFVIGALTPEGDVDLAVMEQLIMVIGKLPWTFHRAFDFCREPFHTLDTIISLGADTLLTSGQAASALKGAALIRSLAEYADGKIDIMAGAGIIPENIREIAVQTGCRSFHLSGRSAVPNRLPEGSGATLNAPGLQPDSYRKSSDPVIIQRAVEKLSG
jgi:copper homeostasis protein